MNKTLYIVSIVLLLVSCKEVNNKKVDIAISKQTDSVAQQIIQVAEFKGQQVTGVTVTDSGRIFVNFPRWRKGVVNSVIEITADNQKKSYPNADWNSWEIGETVVDNKFVGVQSVVAFENRVYVLDTRSQLFENVLNAPRIFVFDLTTNDLIRTYILDKNSYHPDSYVNDLRVDKNNKKIYFTDSGHAGLIVLDIDSGKSKRILDNHKSTSAEMSYLTFGDKQWKNTIHSDGIALDTQNNRLFYHALTGYSLYSINTNSFQIENENQIEENVKFEAKTAAPDGMIFDKAGNLYFADLENNKIQYRKPDGSVHTLIEGNTIKWADTFSIYNNYLYFTNSRINEVSENISNMTFTLNKIKLPSN
ncbi:Major royal jelly protein [Flaviramulus basaltis]|uniref:Major royal jelly protein n=1 Tax=Flaviramulus basaltis TaxID=369401 RepID=A0A1K2IPU5_9FLAO|nr:L-dopachrome tautomerase-related protein [Flaviramulus basaltis]SFZ93723.1 Major royal jelly protein [Flaviramulus basaltis]